MKTRTLIITISIIIIFVIESLAGDEKYIVAMQKNIKSLYEAKSVADLQSAVNAIERISSVEKNKWEPHYYAAFGYVMMANRDSVAAQRDIYLDRALEALKKAVELAPEESEVLALQGFAYMIRLSIDPGSRAPQFAGITMQYLQGALKLNPENPRALGLMAQMQLGTAQFFGSPIDDACKTANAALVKFDNFKSTNPLAPAWGRSMADRITKLCN
jgi:tetratricopeptide (TPR) repeat protein